MDNDDDFTFCKVDSPADQDGPETKKLTTKMDEITIKPKPSTIDHQTNGSIWKVDVSTTKMNMNTVGSLSFNVIDTTSSPKQSTRQPPKQRAKVPFEKGYSQVDWLKLTQTHPDLADLKGESNRRLIPMSEVRQHKSEGSAWTVLKGRVYNLTPYMKFHPGGVDMLKKAVGKDCTALFNKYHAWVNAEFLMEKCLVGVLDDSQVQK